MWDSLEAAFQRYKAQRLAEQQDEEEDVPEHIENVPETTDTPSYEEEEEAECIISLGMRLIYIMLLLLYA